MIVNLDFQIRGKIEAALEYTIVDLKTTKFQVDSVDTQYVNFGLTNGFSSNDGKRSTILLFSSSTLGLAKGSKGRINLVGV